MNLQLLKKRATILADIRAFFAKRQILEVDTPLIRASTVPDPHIESFRVDGGYLQTSPEFAMKCLLSAGSGSIYQICKAFRKEECGRLHAQEFTMLEWYHVGFDHHQLMMEMSDLLCCILNINKTDKKSYADIFQEMLQINPHLADIPTLRAIAHQKKIIIDDLRDKDDWLNLLLTHCIEPHLGRERPLLVYDYPASQAALAKLSHTTPVLAERFEVYYKGIELANGFHELTDTKEQRKRFENERAKRASLGLHVPPLDEELLQALDTLPPCAGVALGIDRLVMLACGASDIAHIY